MNSKEMRAELHHTAQQRTKPRVLDRVPKFRMEDLHNKIYLPKDKKVAEGLGRSQHDGGHTIESGNGVLDKTDALINRGMNSHEALDQTLKEIKEGLRTGKENLYRTEKPIRKVKNRVVKAKKVKLK